MKIGVVIARFQIDELHQGHKRLLEHVISENDRLIVLLGCSAPKVTTKNPLDFKTRRLMIWDSFPQAEVYPIYDKRKDVVWSKQVDTLLKSHYPEDTITLYGSRDSFIPHYSGELTVQEYRHELVFDATSRREEVSKSDPINSADFRRGVIYAAYNKYPQCMPTVDIAILKKGEPGLEVLLVKKPGEDKFRFCGGFGEPEDETFEISAKREVMEEVGVETSDYRYICSKKINDWRYEGTRDKIKTLLFKCNYVFGTPIPQDDLKGGEVRWFNLHAITADDVMTEHIPLLEALIVSEIPSRSE